MGPSQTPSSPNPCDEHTALKPHVAQYALDLVCITEQGEQIKRGGRQRWGECRVGVMEKREGDCRKHERAREREWLAIERKMWGDFPTPVFCSAVHGSVFSRGGRQRERDSTSLSATGDSTARVAYSSSSLLFSLCLRASPSSLPLEGWISPSAYTG